MNAQELSRLPRSRLQGQAQGRQGRPRSQNNISGGERGRGEGGGTFGKRNYENDNIFNTNKRFRIVTLLQGMIIILFLLYLLINFLFFQIQFLSSSSTLSASSSSLYSNSTYNSQSMKGRFQQEPDKNERTKKKSNNNNNENEINNDDDNMNSTNKICYAFLMAGCDPTSPLTYRNYLYNILVASFLLNQQHGYEKEEDESIHNDNHHYTNIDFDIIVLVQFQSSFYPKEEETTFNENDHNDNSNHTQQQQQQPPRLSKQDELWLTTSFSNVYIQYMDDHVPVRDNFYTAQLEKFSILQLNANNQYHQNNDNHNNNKNHNNNTKIYYRLDSNPFHCQQVLYLDADVMPLCPLHYLFQPTSWSSTMTSSSTTTSIHQKQVQEQKQQTMQTNERRRRQQQQQQQSTTASSSTSTSTSSSSTTRAVTAQETNNSNKKLSSSLLRPNVILAWFTEPAHGGFFLLSTAPTMTTSTSSSSTSTYTSSSSYPLSAKSYYQQVQDIIERREEQALNLSWPHWDPILGWGTEPLQRPWKGIPQPSTTALATTTRTTTTDSSSSAGTNNVDVDANNNGNNAMTKATTTTTTAPRRRTSLNWTFHGDFADQGLLYYWTVFQSVDGVSIIFLDTIEDWQHGQLIQVRNISDVFTTTTPKTTSTSTKTTTTTTSTSTTTRSTNPTSSSSLLLSSCLPYGMEYDGNYGSSIEDTLFYNRIPHRDFIHYTGKQKPWLLPYSINDIPTTRENCKSSIDYWYHILYYKIFHGILQRKYPNRKNWPSFPLKLKKASSSSSPLGTYPTYKSMIGTIKKKQRLKERKKERSREKTERRF